MASVWGDRLVAWGVLFQLHNTTQEFQEKRKREKKSRKEKGKNKVNKEKIS